MSPNLSLLCFIFASAFIIHIHALETDSTTVTEAPNTVNTSEDSSSTNEFNTTTSETTTRHRKVIIPEVCLAYTDANSIYHAAEECDRYCCGKCDSRRCCARITLRLDQSTCKGLSVGAVIGQMYTTYSSGFW